MRCLACGTEMVATGSQPYEGLSEIAYYTLQCPSCGDTERHLLPRDRVSVTEVLRSTNAKVAASLPTPLEKLGRTVDREVPRVAASLGVKSPASRRD